MAAKNLSDPAQLMGVTVNGSDGGKIGKVEEVYLDEHTDKPEWAAVKTGMFGGHVSLVPLATAEFDGALLREHEVTLHAEKPVVNKETVPVERVKLGTETVTEEHTVNETVGKEHIETQDESGTAGKQQR